MRLKKKINRSQKYIHLETLSAKILLFATVLALLLSNSPINNYYYYFFHKLHFYSKDITPLFVINDIFMTIFFFYVGLEVKYEIVKGSLNSFQKAALPGIGALGGMLVPAIVYIAFNYSNVFLLRGWAIPTATDIAFSLAVLSIIGPKVPVNLKMFLTALAIFDDVAAIIIIAFFYTSSIQTIYLGLALGCLFILLFLNKIKILKVWPYLFVGIILWVVLLKSGIHPTLAGVLAAFMIPLKKNKQQESPLKKLQNILHPYVALLILPLFAFANAGMTFSRLYHGGIHLTVMLGTFFGLFVGKQLGIFGTSFLAVRYRFALLPDNVRWRELYAISVICGIGFTISLFIGALAFENGYTDYLNSAKLGILFGSLLSGFSGFLLLNFIYRKKNR